MTQDAVCITSSNYAYDSLSGRRSSPELSLTPISTLQARGKTFLSLDRYYLRYQPPFMTDFSPVPRYNVGELNLYLEGGFPVNSDLRRSYKSIEEIRSLPDNWNDNGALHFSTRLIGAVSQIVSNLPIQPYIFPTANDSIQLEYENRQGDYLEFEVFEDGHIKEFLCRNEGGHTATRFIHQEEMRVTVERFYGTQ